MSHKSYLMTKIWKKTACRYPGNTPIDLKECIVNFFNILILAVLHAARECTASWYFFPPLKLKRVGVGFGPLGV